MKFVIIPLLFLALLSACGQSSEPADSPATRTVQRLLKAAPNKTAPAFPDAKYQEQRQAMVQNQIAKRGVEDPTVLEAMRAVPRHELVPENRERQAYEDRPLPIGHGQTISQPFIVAYMTERLKLDPDDRVLEVGTGSGYQAAILGQIVDEVVTIEIIEALAKKAAADLNGLGYQTITALYGDGYFGFEPGAPYDAIIVTAAAEHVPPPLLKQLKPGGRMVIPVGRSGWTQNLQLISKAADGSISTRNLMPVRFVPLTREAR